MCGRYTIRRIDLIIRHGAMDPPLFDTFDERGITPRFNVAPSQTAPVVRMDAEGRGSLDQLNWGLIPVWTKGNPKLKPINARAETVPTSGMFRNAFNKQRCLVPADGFYEWRGAKPPKQPMFIHFPDDHVFFFAGLWERWKPEPDTEPVETFTIITTTPNAEMKSIHNRMPVIVHEKDYRRWLDRDAKGADVADILRPYDDGELETYKVSTLVNKPANQGEELVARMV